MKSSKTKIAHIDLAPYKTILLSEGTYLEITSKYTDKGNLQSVEYLEASVIYNLLEDGANEVMVYSTKEKLHLETDNNISACVYRCTHKPKKIIKVKEYLQYETKE